MQPTVIATGLPAVYDIFIFFVLRVLFVDLGLELDHHSPRMPPPAIAVAVMRGVTATSWK